MTQTGDRAVLLLSGVVPPSTPWIEAAKGATLVCADGGARHALRAGMVPDIVIGDMDSLPRTLARRLARAGTALESHPRDKDQTDAELGLRWCSQRQLREVKVVGFWSNDRLDHVLANVNLLRLGAELGLRLELLHGRQRVALVGERLELDEPAGNLLSLVPVDAPATVSLTGAVRWKLRRAVLKGGASLGVSNECEGGPVSLRVYRGSVLAVVTAV